MTDGDSSDGGVFSTKRGRRRFIQGVGAAGIAGLAGCSGGGSSTTTTNSGGNGTTATTTSGGTSSSAGTELIATFGADVKNYDPVQQSDTTSDKAFNLVYESLVGVDFDGKVQPWLAKSLDQKDTLTFTATLNQGVMFQNGNEMKAQDVKSSFERYKGTPRESDVYDWYDSSTVQGDYTIDIKLSRKYAPFKTALSTVPIVPKEAASGSLDLTKNPIGSGSYQFVKHEPAKLFRIKKYANYWNASAQPSSGLPDTITYRIITDQSEQLNSLKAGDVDFINQPPAPSVDSLKSDSKYTVTEAVQGGFDMLIYPMQVHPFDNQNIRRGVTRLIPRQAIVKSVYNGLAQPAYTPFSPLVSQFVSQDTRDTIKSQYSGYDKTAAASLLKKGFNEAGISKPYSVDLYTNQNPQRVKWCQIIKSSLEASGFFKVKIQQYEWNTYVGKVLSKDSAQINALVALGWSAGWDPDDYIHNLFTKKQYTPACCNINHYDNQQVIDLINQGLTTFDNSKRQKIYEQIATILAKEAPMAYIEFQTTTDAMAADSVKNWKTYPIDSGEYNPTAMPYADQYIQVNK